MNSLITKLCHTPTCCPGMGFLTGQRKGHANVGLVVENAKPDVVQLLSGQGLNAKPGSETVGTIPAEILGEFVKQSIIQAAENGAAFKTPAGGLSFSV
jgi:hypothetical protein